MEAKGGRGGKDEMIREYNFHEYICEKFQRDVSCVKNAKSKLANSVKMTK